MHKSNTIGVVGLWHLGCVIAATWSKLGHQVVGIDSDAENVAALSDGRPPLFEPGLETTVRASLKEKTLAFSTEARAVAGCRYVFLAYDTPVRDDDTCDLTILDRAVAAIAPHLASDAIVIVSAQVPVGTSRRWREQLQRVHPTIEIVYSPENLRLGEAMQCYLQPGHVVIGADEANAGEAVAQLFLPMQAELHRMNLPSAEMTKHGINAFLATCVSFANQLADMCRCVGADYGVASAAMKNDPRIGKKAYLGSGIGFSGGTLGRDLRVLDDCNRQRAAGVAPLFRNVWDYNQQRPMVVVQEAERSLAGLSGKTVALFGLTYKPGTSTLRRSIPLCISRALAERGASLRLFDPQADWTEVRLPARHCVTASAEEAAQGADLIIVLTEWPQFEELDYARIGQVLRQRILFDPKCFLKSQFSALHELGYSLLTL